MGSRLRIFQNWRQTDCHSEYAEENVSCPTDEKWCRQARCGVGNWKEPRPKTREKTRLKNCVSLLYKGLWQSGTTKCSQRANETVRVCNETVHWLKDFTLLSSDWLVARDRLDIVCRFISVQTNVTSVSEKLPLLPELRMRALDEVMWCDLHCTCSVLCMPTWLNGVFWIDADDI